MREISNSNSKSEVPQIPRSAVTAFQRRSFSAPSRPPPIPPSPHAPLFGNPSHRSESVSQRSESPILGLASLSLCSTAAVCYALPGSLTGLAVSASCLLLAALPACLPCLLACASSIPPSRFGLPSRKPRLGHRLPSASRGPVNTAFCCYCVPTKVTYLPLFGTPSHQSELVSHRSESLGSSALCLVPC